MNTTAIIILATTAMGRDRGSDVKRRITRRLLRIILAPDQFERTTRDTTSLRGRLGCRVPESPPRRLVSLSRQGVERPEDDGDDGHHDENDRDGGGGGRRTRRRRRQRNGVKKKKGRMKECAATTTA
jgi:hypothetical protein